jgi:hypothetical protein
MKYTNFDYSGGFPFDQSIMKRMQLAYFEHLTAYAKQLGCADVGNFIIHGCQIDGANITPGMMYIDGEMCPFAGAVGTLETKIKKITTTTNAPFENGTNPPVFKETIAQVDATGTALSGYTRFYFVSDQNYVSTENNFSDAWIEFLMSIEYGAEKNVQANFTQNNTLADDYIKNKPVGNLLTYLYKGTYIHGDLLSGLQLVTISFPSVGTTSYSVLCQVKGSGVWQRDAKVNCVVRESTKTASSFQISLCDYTNESVQDIRVDFFIIPN